MAERTAMLSAAFTGVTPGIKRRQRMEQDQRRATSVKPVERISKDQVMLLHEASLAILENPGIHCFNEQAANLLKEAGCTVEEVDGYDKSWQVHFPRDVVEKAIRSAPTKVVLGARKRENRLVLDSHVPAVYFGTGSETNIYLETELADFVGKDDSSQTLRAPVYRNSRGSVRNLSRSAKLCDNLDNVDFFIRNVNVQDDDITADNKDVNVFLASLMHTSKHVQAGIVEADRLDDVLTLAELVAGGPDELKENPIISFITCLIKSPLQMVEDTTDKLIRIAQKGMPVVISSSPQGGSTAPILEEGMVALINAEILAGITVAQVVNPGTPVLYGAVPVRARLDTLHDLYGAPEFVHYNTDCVQMARHYEIPCYSTAGVGDAKVPGMQATIEKVFAQLAIAMSGAQYIHYAFGLLDKTNVFSPVQAVLDDAHIGIVRDIVRPSSFAQAEADAAVEEVRRVFSSSTKLFARHIRKAMRKGLVSAPYPFETQEESDEVFPKAVERLDEIMARPDTALDKALLDKIYAAVPGLLPRERFNTNS